MSRSPKNPLPEPPEGAACEALGKVIGDGLATDAAQERGDRQDVSRSSTPDLRQWAAIQSSLPRRRRGRLIARRGFRLVAPALAAGAAAVWLLLRAGHPPLTYVAEGFEVATGGAVHTAAGESGKILFSDGSTIALGGGTSGRIVAPARSAAEKAHFVLEGGAAHLDVVHRPDTRWAVEAGPFRVDVKGTEFSVSWSPSQRHFRLAMRRGEVAVTGSALPARMTLVSGMILDVTGDEIRVHESEAPDSPSPPPASRRAAPGPGAEGHPAPIKTTAAGGGGRSRASAIVLRPPAGDPRVAARDSISGGATTSRLPTGEGGAGPEKDDDTMHKNDMSKTSRAGRAVGVASAVGIGLLATASVAAPPAKPGSPVLIGSDGKLGGPMTGYAWVASGIEATISAPSPCDTRGCFRDTKGQLCTRGRLPALRCTGQRTPQFSCNWETNWGSMIGMHATDAGGPWQAGAPSSISIAYRDNGDRGTHRLTAHVTGDPDSKAYCVDSYQSGQIIEPGQLKTACWADAGEALSNFQQVDKIGLQLISTESPLDFDYCVTAIAVNGSVGHAGGGGGGSGSGSSSSSGASVAGGDDSSHVAIGDYGKLGGEMSGYAWVAGGSGTVFTSPEACNSNGCFRNARGRLCAQGTIPSLRCNGKGDSSRSCDWQTNWGAMIGLNANVAGAAWGTTAPSTVAVDFSGRPAVYRLLAHLAGAPDSESFCVDGYQSGQAVDARAFRTKCWSSSGDTLRGYQSVDRIGLQIMSADGPVAFDVCISDIVVR